MIRLIILAVAIFTVLALQALKKVDREAGFWLWILLVWITPAILYFNMEEVTTLSGLFVSMVEVGFAIIIIVKMAVHIVFRKVQEGALPPQKADKILSIAKLIPSMFIICAGTILLTLALLLK